MKTFVLLNYIFSQNTHFYLEIHILPQNTHFLPGQYTFLENFKILSGKYVITVLIFFIFETFLINFMAHARLVIPEIHSNSGYTLLCYAI